LQVESQRTRADNVFLSANIFSSLLREPLVSRHQKRFVLLKLMLSRIIIYAERVIKKRSSLFPSLCFTVGWESIRKYGRDF
jgi:hypothetical protein